MHMRFMVALLALLGLCGCTTGRVDDNIQFDANSKKSLVVMGWEGLDQWRGRTIELNFKRIKTDGTLDKEWFYVMNGNGWEAMKPVEYFVVEAEPGTYIAEATVTTAYKTTIFSEFCRGTFAFDVSAGKAVYIGNYSTPERQPTITAVRPDLEAAKAQLGSYANVHVGLEIASIRQMPHPPLGHCDGV